MVLMVLTALPITAILLSTTIYITEAVGSATATCDDANINNHPKKPNVVILFADNLGFNDVGAFRTANSTGSSTASSVERSRTPRTDQLANDGLKLMHWNSPAVLCSASRAGLMTGKYSVRTGIYPGVFKPDAEFGLLANETTIADYLREEGYATKIVGKWHLGSRPGFLPTDRGFDEWFGIPYHMSGGSLDGHVCSSQPPTQWLPLFDGQDIVEQPVDLRNLAPRYLESAKNFIDRSVAKSRPFFLYLAFSHVHQLCAPRLSECQWASSHFSRNGEGFAADFGDAVEEMDWILGGILDALRDAGVEDDTLVIFTSDNGPWTAEQECSGAKGQFKGTWLKENVDMNCTACPSEYIPAPLPDSPRRCIFPGSDYEVVGIHCGEDTGLGSAWEANVRMPAIVRWKSGGIPAGEESSEMVSTLDVLPTVLSIIGRKFDDGSNFDGIDVTDVFLGSKSSTDPNNERAIFFWRDGFRDGPLPAPFGRFDVVAVKLGWYKLWYWTKSSHHNDDEEVFHDPPLIFDVLNDPAEAYPLDPSIFLDLVKRAQILVLDHKESVDWMGPLTLSRDPKYLPCSNVESGCRTSGTSPQASDASFITAEE